MIIPDFITVSKYLPSSVATQARMASRAAVLRPGEGSDDCWGRHTASLSQSHSPSTCLFFSLSPARDPPLRQGQTDTVTVLVLVRPDVPSLSTRGTKSVRVEDWERDSGWSWERSTRLAVVPGGRKRGRKITNLLLTACCNFTYSLCWMDAGWYDLEIMPRNYRAHVWETVWFQSVGDWFTLQRKEAGQVCLVCVDALQLLQKIQYTVAVVPFMCRMIVCRAFYKQSMVMC